MSLLKLILFGLLIVENEGARIFAVFPTPSISHQVVIRPLILELVQRGHEVVMLTADPIYKLGEGPPNLKEIDAHDMSYKIWRAGFIGAGVAKGKEENMESEMQTLWTLLNDIFENQFKIDEVQALLKNATQFDLLLLEAYHETLLGLSHIFKAPVIQISSMGMTPNVLDVTSPPIHPILYPTNVQPHTNYPEWDKLVSFYTYYREQKFVTHVDRIWNLFLQRVFGKDVPTVQKLRKNVDIIFLNTHSILENNRPLPLNVLYIGGIHLKPEQDLPQDLKSYLDASKNGVIYVSFGTNVDPAMFPPEKIAILVKAFSETPYDVLWKWNNDELPGQAKNIKIAKWLPQPDLLKHPKIKLFITQGGSQSADEVISAGVPVLGIPIFGDQWYNVDRFVKHKVGLKVDLESVTVEKLTNAISMLTNDNSYRDNMIRLRNIIVDTPMTPLERATWWTEYILRHKGAKHLRSPAAFMHWTKYYELKLISIVLGVVLLVVTIVFYAILKLCKLLFRRRKNPKVKRS